MPIIDKTMDLLICLPMTHLAYKLLDQAINLARESITEPVNELINLSNDQLAQLKKQIKKQFQTVCEQLQTTCSNAERQYKDYCSLAEQTLQQMNNLH